MLLGVPLLYCHWVGACCPEVSMPKREVVLRVPFVYIKGGICVLPSCLTLLSLKMTLERETPTEMMLTFSLALLWKFLLRSHCSYCNVKKEFTVNAS